jgi:drug/metabolite transporter (DMT)-like permease
MGELCALLSAIFMGIGNVCARKGMEGKKVDRFSGLLITLLINNCLNFFLILIYLLNYGWFPINLPGLVYNVVAGLFNSFTGRWALFCSIAYIGASRAGILKVVTPLFAILGGVFLLKETITCQAWLGIAVVLAGVVFISVETSEKEGRLSLDQSVKTKVGPSFPPKVSSPARKKSGFSGMGIVLGLSASLFFAGGNVCRKLGVSYIPNPLVSVTIGSFAALLSAVTVRLFCGKGFEVVNTFKNIDIYYFFSGIFTSLALYSLFGALQLIPISIASSISASEALFTIMASRVLTCEREMLNGRLVAGALVVTGGIVTLLTM